MATHHIPAIDKLLKDFADAMGEKAAAVQGLVSAINGTEKVARIVSVDVGTKLYQLEDGSYIPVTDDDPRAKYSAQSLAFPFTVRLFGTRTVPTVPTDFVVFPGLPNLTARDID